MKVEDFNYQLPEELIAQTPLDKRSASKLLVIDRKTDRLIDDRFFNLPNYLNANDVLVFNDTKVLPSRIYGNKTSTGAVIEFLLLHEENDGWEVLVRPARRIKKGTIVDFAGLMQGEIVEKREEGRCLVHFYYQGIFLEILERLGKMPLPPYIHQELADPKRYQTVYATHLGSAAAPTAGLHFDNDLIAQIMTKGIEICYLTLHIGLATFRPVTENDVQKHRMHSEYYEMNTKTAELLCRARHEDKRIIAVGTTSARTLEAIYSRYQTFKAVSEKTDIFIYPGYRFKAVDALITNFHLPKSTLIMLVSAFYDRDKILKTYQHAIKERYRFFSFGDAMFMI
ncbi:MAG: tRNA preQ1(34) S-adenosylmethionine ribosyltransferase-isomerase QueA [Bacilli bacterium]|nr:tRNA preQ1(34) S-adenosylmethionine ribosyltransferase-isomerase QueA [Bacilli bacterium]MDD4076735.1 tRNA preQ1(34) S-adenosylmethionine ribosyltransferase-isomerase QueA [Bacilli bacterium]MDD4387835.1 tRNA preQ1(34) S-adenosylmethionine ribosyltransferase-isomerase QueA [Bacilli bacterium]